MSLRSFHIFFIFVASIMCSGVAYLEYLNWKQSGGNALHIAGICGAAMAAIGLLVYAVYFFRKTRKLT